MMLLIESEMPAAEPRRRKTRSRGAILEATLRLLETTPLDQITVRDIAEQARIGYATFFRHFPDKDAVLTALASDEIAGLLSLALPLSYTAETRPSTEALCRYVWNHRALWSVLLTGGAAGFFREEFIRQAEGVAARHPRSGGRLPAGLAVVFSVSAAIELLSWWLKQPQPLPVAEMARIIDRLAVQPTLD